MKQINYSIRGTMDFSTALHVLKDGRKVARSQDKRNGTFIAIIPGGRMPAPTSMPHVMPGTMIEMAPELFIFRVRAPVTSWVPTQADMLAEDWEVV